MKPKIGMFSSAPFNEAKRYYCTKKTYAQAIIDSGGIPVMIPATPHLTLIPDYADMIDGLLIPGGEDVNPLVYLEEPVPQVTNMSRVRDEFEIALIKAMYALDKPIMGICRGLQVINVALGGTLIQDISSQSENKISHKQSSDIPEEPTHSVGIMRGSLLAQLLGEQAYVNSYHHQAVKKIGENLSATAFSSDGIIEGIEHINERIFAVQWHPEDMYLDDNRFNELFFYLVNLAKKDNE